MVYRVSTQQNRKRNQAVVVVTQNKVSVGQRQEADGLPSLSMWESYTLHKPINT